MNFTLLIWEMVPEKTELYLIPNDAADEYRNYLSQAHNRFINSDEMNDGMNFLNAALCESKFDNGLEEPWSQHVGVFAKYKQDFGKHPLILMNANNAIMAVYLSGFIL